jgi:hypothetical protein
MSIFPAGYLNSHKDDADDAIDKMHQQKFNFSLNSKMSSLYSVLVNMNESKSMNAFFVVLNFLHNRLFKVRQERKVLTLELYIFFI